MDNEYINYFEKSNRTSQALPRRHPFKGSINVLDHPPLRLASQTAHVYSQVSLYWSPSKFASKVRPHPSSRKDTMDNNVTDYTTDGIFYENNPTFTDTITMDLSVLTPNILAETRGGNCLWLITNIPTSFRVLQLGPAVLIRLDCR